MKVKNNIRETRTQKKISGTKVARQVGISPQYFYDIEKGERNLSADLAVKIADALDATLDQILLRTPGDNEFNQNIGRVERIEIDTNSLLLENLKLITDDEGYFFEDLRKDLFHIIDEQLFFYLNREENFIVGLDYDDFVKYFNEKDQFTSYQKQEFINEFNNVINYRTFKQIIPYLDIEEIDEVLSGVRKIIELHEIEHEKTPSNEKEFIQKLELSNEKLLKEFDLELDGKKLTEDEAKGIIAYLRSLRQFEK